LLWESVVSIPCEQVSQLETLELPNRAAAFEELSQTTTCAMFQAYLIRFPSTGPILRNEHDSALGNNFFHKMNSEHFTVPPKTTHSTSLIRNIKRKGN
jgi:hypothetical protein